MEGKMKKELEYDKEKRDKEDCERIEGKIYFIRRRG